MLECLIILLDYHWLEQIYSYYNEIWLFKMPLWLDTCSIYEVTKYIFQCRH